MLALEPNMRKKIRCAVRVAIISTLLRVGFCLLSQTVHLKIVSLCLICVANKQHHRFSFAGIVSMSIFRGLSHECPEFSFVFGSEVPICCEHLRVSVDESRAHMLAHKHTQRETNTRTLFNHLCCCSFSLNYLPREITCI